MSYQLGDVVPLSVTVKDADGTPANADSVTLTVTLPDGTTDVTAGITPTATGVYDHDFIPAQAGVHQVRWVATGTNAGAFEDAFSVAATAGANFISLAEAKTHLKKDPAKTADDAELLEFISAACSKIVELIGPVAPTAYVETTARHWCRGTIVLGQRPIIAVAAVEVAGGDTIPQADLDNGVSGWELDAGAGLLTFSGSWWPTGRIRVTYRAGRTPLPGNVRLAGLELTAHLWRTIKFKTAGARPGVPGDDTIVIAGQAYALPNRVRELLGLGKNPTAQVLVG